MTLIELAFLAFFGSAHSLLLRGPPADFDSFLISVQDAAVRAQALTASGRNATAADVLSVLRSQVDGVEPAMLRSDEAGSANGGIHPFTQMVLQMHLSTPVYPEFIRPSGYDVGGVPNAWQVVPMNFKTVGHFVCGCPVYFTASWYFLPKSVVNDYQLCESTGHGKPWHAEARDIIAKAATVGKAHSQDAEAHSHPEKFCELAQKVADLVDRGHGDHAPFDYKRYKVCGYFPF